MDYLYGTFSDEQIKDISLVMHNEIHKLLLYKDQKIKDQIFESDEIFINYFRNLLYRIGGLNDLLGRPKEMVSLMSTLQAAYIEIKKDDFDYKVFRRLILDAHGYIKAMFKEV